MVDFQSRNDFYNGYDLGYEDGEIAGENEGYEKGYEDGEIAGENEGYERGENDGRDELLEEIVNTISAYGIVPVALESERTELVRAACEQLIDIITGKEKNLW